MKDRIELFLAPGSCSPLSPGRRFQELRHAIAKRAYDMFASRGFTHGHDLRDWFLAETELVRPISIEMSETETELTVKAGLPGFAEKDIDVRVEPRRLFIAGDCEEKSEQPEKDKSRVVYSEWKTNRIFRTIDLPAEVDPDKVTANMSNGVLQISLPKKETSKKVAIEGKAA